MVMAKKQSKIAICTKIVSMCVTLCFLVNSVSFAFEGTAIVSRQKAHTLSAFSRFNPIVSPDDNNSSVQDLLGELSKMDLVRDQQELVSIVYAIRLIGNAMDHYGHRLLAASNGLKIILGMHLPQLPFEGFRWRDMSYDEDKNAFNIRFVDNETGVRKDMWVLQSKNIPKAFSGMQNLSTKECDLQIFIDQGIEKELYELIREEALNTREEIGRTGACQKHSKELARRLIKAGKDAKVVKHKDEVHFWVEVEGLVCDPFPEGLLEPYSEAARGLGDKRFIIEKKDHPVIKKMYPGKTDEDFTREALENAKDEISYYWRRHSGLSRDLRDTMLKLADFGFTEEKINKWEDVVIYRRHLARIEAIIDRLSRQAREEALRKAIDGDTNLAKSEGSGEKAITSQEAPASAFAGADIPLMKACARETKEEMSGVGACREHSQELARRLIRAGKDAKVIKHNDHIHFWVEVDGYVCDAFPEGMPAAYTDAARAFGEPAFTVESKGDPVIEKLYQGTVQRELTEEARNDAADDEAFYLKEKDKKGELLGATLKRLAYQGLSKEEIDKHESVVYFRGKLREIEKHISFARAQVKEEENFSAADMDVIEELSGKLEVLSDIIGRKDWEVFETKAEEIITLLRSPTEGTKLDVFLSQFRVRDMDAAIHLDMPNYINIIINWVQVSDDGGMRAELEEIFTEDQETMKAAIEEMKKRLDVFLGSKASGSEENQDDAEKLELSYQDLEEEGYKAVVSEEEKAGYKEIRVKVSHEGDDLYSDILIKVVEISKTVVIEQFYPEFPADRKGRGRALLRKLLLTPEYSGYRVIASASEWFQKSFLQMEDFEPMATIEGANIYDEAGKEAVRDLNELLTHPTFMSNPELWAKLIDAWEDATLFGIVPINIHGDGAPAIAIMRAGDTWTQAVLTDEQHELINEAWGQLWDACQEDYRMLEGDSIYKDIEERLEGLNGEHEINIHSPPDGMFYNVLYSMDMDNILPSPGGFKILTHPGTYRTDLGAARSINLLIPAGALEFVRIIRTDRPAAYKEWLDHEVKHLADRLRTPKGQEPDELAVVSQAPIGAIIEIYNFIKQLERGMAQESVEYILKQIVEPDPSVRRQALETLGQVVGESLVLANAPDRGTHQLTVKDRKGHRYFVVDSRGNLIEEYKHIKGVFQEVTFRNVVHPDKKITLRTDKENRRYSIYVDEERVGEVDFITLPEEIEYEFWDINNIKIAVGEDLDAEESIRLSILNIFAKWAQEGGKSLVAFNVNDPEEALMLEKVLVNPTGPAGKIISPEDIRQRELTDRGTFQQPFVFIGGSPSPYYLHKNTSGNFQVAKEIISGHAGPSEDIRSAAKKAETQGITVGMLMTLAEIKTADDLIQYIDALEHNVNNVATQAELGSNWDKKYLQPLFELFFMRLVEDFSGSREFIRKSREILKRENALVLRQDLQDTDSDLFRAFKKIRRSQRTGDASFRFYGVLMHYLVQNPEEYFGHIYEQLIHDHKKRDIAISKKGLSYHLRGDSVIHVHDKYLLFEGENPRYMKGVEQHPFIGEKTPRDAKDTENAEKIHKALEVWASGGEEKVAPDTRALIEERRQQFMDSATIVGLDMKTSLLFSDPANDVVRVMHSGRGRHVMFFSLKYLSELDINSQRDMRELAFWLNFGQGFLDRHDEVANNGFTEDEKWDAIRTNIAGVNRSFLKDPEDRFFVDPRDLKESLAVRMKEDTLISFQEVLSQVVTLERNADTEIQRGKNVNINNKFFYCDVAKTYLKCHYRYEELGLHSWAERAYQKMKWVMTGVQEFDIGQLPMQYQGVLVLTALRSGHFKDFITELETLLTAKSTRRKRPVYGGEIAYLGMLLKKDNMIFKKINRALATQLEALPAEELEGLGDLRAKVESLFEEYYENGIKNFDSNSVTEEVPPQAADNIVIGLLPDEPLWGDIVPEGRESKLSTEKTRKEFLLYPVSSAEVFEVPLYSGQHQSVNPDDLDSYCDEEIDKDIVRSIVDLAASLGIGQARSIAEKVEIFYKVSDGLGFDRADENYSAMIALAAQMVFTDAGYAVDIKYAPEGFYGKHFYLLLKEQGQRGAWLVDPTIVRYKDSAEEYSKAYALHIAKTNRYWRTATSEDLDALSKEGAKEDKGDVVARALGLIVQKLEKLRVDEDTKGSKLVIGIDTSWIPPIERAKIQGLLNKIQNLSEEENGVAGLKVVISKGEGLAKELLKLNEEDPEKMPKENMIILGDKRVLEEEAFDDLRADSRDDNGAFFGKLTIPATIPQGYCIDIKLMQWLGESMKTAFTTGKRALMFPIELAPMEKVIEKLEKRFRSQEAKIGAAA